MNICEKCPGLENERFLLRQVEKGDCGDYYVCTAGKWL